MNLTTLSALLLTGSVALLSGCGILVGSVKPVVEPSSEFSIAELNQLNPKWSRLAVASGKSKLQEPQESYQLRESDNLIALNSTCRPRFESESLSLKKTLQSFVGGLGPTREQRSETLLIDGREAWYSKGVVRVEGRSLAYEAIVTRDRDCLFDLMHLASEASLSLGSEDFSRFYKSMKFKK